jgi:hypothetical protein
MSTITKDQIKIIGTICSKLKYTPDEKAAMISSFSNGRETHTPQLRFAEADAFIKHLKAIQGDTNHNQGLSRMLGKMFGYARDMGWTKQNPAGKLVADVDRINRWIMTYGYLKKPINDFTFAELPKLVSQFEMVYKDFLNKI